MKLQEYDKEFSPGGVIGARRRFWKQVYNEVKKIQKVQGDNVKLSESQDGTTISVDERSGLNPKDVATPGACCKDGVCLGTTDIATCAGLGGTFHMGSPCSDAFCYDILPHCSGFGSCPINAFDGSGFKYLTLTHQTFGYMQSWGCTGSPSHNLCTDGNAIQRIDVSFDEVLSCNSSGLLDCLVSGSVSSTLCDGGGVGAGVYSCGGTVYNEGIGPPFIPAKWICSGDTSACGFFTVWSPTFLHVSTSATEWVDRSHSTPTGACADNSPFGPDSDCTRIWTLSNRCKT